MWDLPIIQIQIQGGFIGMTILKHSIVYFQLTN